MAVRHTLPGKDLRCVEYDCQRAGQFMVRVTVWDLATQTAQQSVDQERFLVLWVDLTIAGGGTCPDEGNNKRDACRSRTRNPARYELGLGDFVFGRHGWGVAIHGAAIPTNWPAPLELNQWGYGATYKGPNGDQPNEQLDGLDVQEELLDNELPHMYHMDYPGVSHNSGQNDIHRIRCTFVNEVSWGGHLCSNTLEWLTTQSWHKEADAWVAFADPQVNPASPGDNALYLGWLPPEQRTWNMYSP